MFCPNILFQWKHVVILTTLPKIHLALWNVRSKNILFHSNITLRMFSVWYMDLKYMQEERIIVKNFIFTSLIAGTIGLGDIKNVWKTWTISTNGFQLFNNSKLNHDYVQKQWKYICHIIAKIHQYFSVHFKPLSSVLQNLMDSMAQIAQV